MCKISFITGITGQDGSYLAELLLSKGYKVYGIVRRTSLLYSYTRIDHIRDKIHLEYGDISDGSSLTNYITKITRENDNFEVFEIYNLAAQSHVKISFEIPEYTSLIDGLGTLKILEAIRTLPDDIRKKTKFYQAGTSEMFGDVLEKPQKETTPFNPQSPYACAKVYSHFLVNNYRDAYDLFACNGILFNHETIAGFMPLIYKQNGIIDIKPISEIVKYNTLNEGVMINEKDNVYQEGQVETDLYVWDNNEWTRVIHASGYPHDKINNNKNPKFVISKNAAYMATCNHEIIMEDGSDICVDKIEIGNKVKLVDYPQLLNEDLINIRTNIYKNNHETNNELQCKYCGYTCSRKSNHVNHELRCKEKMDFYKNEIDEVEAEFLGLFVGDGNNSGSSIRFTNKTLDLHNYVIDLWEKICIRNNKEGKYKINENQSGFKPYNTIYQTTYTGFNDFFKKYKIYNEDKTKRVPIQVLNSDTNIQLKFLEGYNKADGLKKNNCVYEFKNFKTNSATLAQGILFLLNNTTQQNFNINIEHVYAHGKKRIYYSINILSNTRFSVKNGDDKCKLIKRLHEDGVSQREIYRRTKISRNFISNVINNNYTGCKTHHYEKSNNEVKKIIDMSDYDGWFYDLETESGKFHAGIGKGRIHNSPRRGENFVTMKIVNGVKKIVEQEKQYEEKLSECIGEHESVQHNDNFEEQRISKPEYVLSLGNIDSMRDWGHAKDYVYGMWLMLQQEKPDNYVLATGKTYTVRDFIERCFAKVGKEIIWEGKGINEVGREKSSGKILVKIDEKYFRPCEVDFLLGDPTKAETKLGWERKYDLDSLIVDMMK